MNLIANIIALVLILSGGVFALQGLACCQAAEHNHLVIVPPIPNLAEPVLRPSPQDAG